MTTEPGRVTQAETTQTEPPSIQSTFVLLYAAETATLHGEALVQLWRRSYDVRPPALDEIDERWPGRDPRYAVLAPRDVPRTESLRDTVERLLPFWRDEIAPTVRNGQRVLIVAHGNSLRGLVKEIDRTRPHRPGSRRGEPRSPPPPPPGQGLDYSAEGDGPLTDPCCKCWIRSAISATCRSKSRWRASSEPAWSGR